MQVAQERKVARVGPRVTGVVAVVAALVQLVEALRPRVESVEMDRRQRSLVKARPMAVAAAAVVETPVVRVALRHRAVVVAVGVVEQEHHPRGTPRIQPVRQVMGRMALQTLVVAVAVAVTALRTPATGTERVATVGRE